MNGQVNLWMLIEEGNYSLASEMFLRQYEIDNDLPNLQNGALAYLLMKEYKTALRCYERIIERQTPHWLTQSEFVDAGICCWCLHRTDEAIQRWKASLSVPYRDAAGGLVPVGMLLFASHRLGDNTLINEAKELLVQLWNEARPNSSLTAQEKKHDEFSHANLRNWPGIIVPFLLDLIPLSSVIQVLKKTENWRLHLRQECQFHFYVALKALMLGDESTYRRNLKYCAESKNGILEHEYHIATYEVN